MYSINCHHAVLVDLLEDLGINSFIHPEGQVCVKENNIITQEELDKIVIGIDSFEFGGVEALNVGMKEIAIRGFVKALSILRQGEDIK